MFELFGGMTAEPFRSDFKIKINARLDMIDNVFRGLP